MLTEKKLTDLLFKALPEFAKNDFETRWAECEAMGNHIADRLKEDVVWEKLVQLDCDPDNPKDLAGWSEEDDGDYVVYILGDHEKIEPGHEYIVTVRKN